MASDQEKHGIDIVDELSAISEFLRNGEPPDDPEVTWSELNEWSELMARAARVIEALRKEAK